MDSIRLHVIGVAQTCETCFINVLHATYFATYLQPSAHKGNIFHAICCNISIWIYEKHDNKVWCCATFPHSTQLISFMVCCFILCTIPLKYRRCHRKTYYVSNYAFFTLLHEWVDRGQIHRLEKLLCVKFQTYR